MFVDVPIRYVSTGEVRTYHQDFDWEFLRYAIFQWTEGNFGCDCNRSLFFWRDDEDTPEDFGQCGETRYAIDKLIVRHTGDHVPLDLRSQRRRHAAGTTSREDA